MIKYKGKLAGILGTISIHLIVVIIFMLFQIRSLHIKSSDEFVVEFEESEEPDEEKTKVELPAKTIEKILQGDEELLNIARNLASKSDVKIDPTDYINKVKEELIKSGKLNTDNFIDEKQDKSQEPLSFKSGADTNKPTYEAEKMAANYKGATSIYYDLPGRYHRYLPIPVYKCQGAGKIVLSIEVDQKGIVEKALVMEDESTTSDICLVETAVKTALISRFSYDKDSPKLQKGTLTYHFVAQ